MLLTLNAENPSRALAYVRVSSQRQVDEGVSIEAQIKRIKEYAKGGWQWVALYMAHIKPMHSDVMNQRVLW